MAIEVECPTGCRFAAPSKVQGLVVRCPSCQAVIQVSDSPVTKTFDSVTSATKPLVTSQLWRAHWQPTAPQSSSSETRRELGESRMGAGPRRGRTEARLPDPGFWQELSGTAPQVISSSESYPPPEINLRTDRETPNTAPAPLPLAERAASRLRNQQRTCFIGASVLLVLAGLQLWPAGLEWQEWSQADLASRRLPRWWYSLIAISFAHVWVSAMLIWLRDWASLRGGAGFLLAMACGYAFITSWGLWTAPTSAGFLSWQVSSADQRSAWIWCGAMACLYTLACGWFVREYSLWKRTAQLYSAWLANSAPNLKEST